MASLDESLLASRWQVAGGAGLQVAGTGGAGLQVVGGAASLFHLLIPLSIDAPPPLASTSL